MLILGIEMLVPGNEVGHRIGNPTGIESNSEAESASTATTSTATNYQTSEYILPCINVFRINYYLLYFVVEYKICFAYRWFSQKGNCKSF